MKLFYHDCSVCHLPMPLSEYWHDKVEAGEEICICGECERESE